MKIASQVMRRLSPQIRSLLLARREGDDVFLMERNRVFKSESGTLKLTEADRYEQEFDPIVSAKWIVEQAREIADGYMALVTPEEKELLVEDEFAVNAEIPFGEELVAGEDLLKAMIMRRLIGYRRTAQQAADICTHALASLMDPAIMKSMRIVGGWHARDMDQFIEDWDIVDDQGRQVGMSGRSDQVACAAWALRNQIVVTDDGRSVMKGIHRMGRECMSKNVPFHPIFHDAVHPMFNHDMHASMSRSMSFTPPETKDLVRLSTVADGLPSALRDAGVKPAFWRMVLRMRPSQIRAMTPLFETSFTDDTGRMLNILTSVGEDLLPPTLIRQLCTRWGEGMVSVIEKRTLEIVALRMAKGIDARRSRETLRDAVAKIFDVLESIESQAKERYDLENPEDKPPPLNHDVESVGLDHMRIDFMARIGREFSESFRRADERSAAIVANMHNDIPANKTWKHLVEASDVWHAEMQARMDDGDGRTWKPLIAGPMQIGPVTATELCSAAELRAESRNNDHCVGNGEYADDCMEGGTRIVALRIGQSRMRSTLEIGLINGRWRIVQHRGPSNSNPRKELATAVDRLLKRMNEEQSKISEFEIHEDRPVVESAPCIFLPQIRRMAA
jgi:hypothetical protein